MARFKRQRIERPKESPNLNGQILKVIESITDTLNASGDEIARLNGELTLGGNTVGQVKRLRFEMPTDPPWRAASYDTGWKVPPSEVLQYLMIPGGEVQLRGGAIIDPAVFGGGFAASGIATNVSILPAGYAPKQTTLLPFTNILAGVLGWATVAVLTNGTLLYIAGGNADGLVFDGLRWYAGPQAAPPHQFTGGAWPLRVQTQFEKVRTLVALGCRLLDQGAQNGGQGTPWVDWQDVGDGTVRVNGVWGLQWGRKYELLVYLSPEDAEEE